MKKSYEEAFSYYREEIVIWTKICTYVCTYFTLQCCDVFRDINGEREGKRNDRWHIVSVVSKDKFARTPRDTEQIPTNGRKSKCCIENQRYPNILSRLYPPLWRYAGVRSTDSTGARILRTKWFSSQPSAATAAVVVVAATELPFRTPPRTFEKGRNPPTFSTSTGRGCLIK